MSETNFVITVSGKKRVGAVQWWLDSPVNGQAVCADKLQADGMLVNGWFVVHAPRWWQRAEQGTLLIKNGSDEILVPLLSPRPDVIKQVLKSVDGQRQLKCGFTVRLPLASDHFSLFYRQGENDLLLATVAIRAEHKVLKGEQGWLFLDNDTNNSVEQFLGRKLLPQSELHTWQRYAQHLAAFATQHHFKTVLLLVPSKERVYSHFYPLKAGKQSPVDQVVSRCSPHCAVVYPELELRNFSQQSYLKTDTHWSALGAQLGTRLTAQALGLDSAQLSRVFAADQYRLYTKTGDLGAKVYPPMQADEWMLANYNFNKFVIYDNKLPNFGRIMLVQDSSALHAGTCLLFSSSSAYSMLGYLARTFKTLILVHTAGNIDPSLLQLVKPDFVVAQTNARFVVKAPVTDYNLSQVMKDKLGAMSGSERAEFVAAAGTNCTGHALAASLHALLEQALAELSAGHGEATKQDRD